MNKFYLVRYLTAITCLIASLSWLVFIFGNSFDKENAWRIASNDNEAIVKFLLVLVPCLALSILVLGKNELKSSEESKLKKESELLKMKIEKRELELKLKQLND